MPTIPGQFRISLPGILPSHLGRPLIAIGTDFAEWTRADISSANDHVIEVLVVDAASLEDLGGEVLYLDLGKEWYFLFIFIFYCLFIWDHSPFTSIFTLIILESNETHLKKTFFFKFWTCLCSTLFLAFLLGITFLLLYRNESN